MLHLRSLYERKQNKKTRLEPNLVGLYYSLLSFNDVCSLQTAVAILNIDYIARTSGHTVEIIMRC